MNIRSMLIILWDIFDPIYFLFTRLHYIRSDCNQRCFFRVRVTKFKGENVALSDGTIIKKNDLLVKIHLHNSKLLKESLAANGSINRGRSIYNMVLHSMPLLAEYIEKHPMKTNIKGIIGITTVNKGVKPLGFDLVHPKSKLYQLLKRIMQFPIYLLSTSSISLSQFKRNKPVYLMMSTETLFSKYLKSV